MAKKFKLEKNARKKLKAMVKRVEHKLLIKPRRHCIKYPCGSRASCWEIKKIDEINQTTFDALKDAGNIYCIFTRKEQCGWVARYIGQSKSGGLKGRLRSHLVHKSRDTGSQLEKIKCMVGEGERISISYVLVKPETLRHYVEESILKQSECSEFPWNEHMNR